MRFFRALHFLSLDVVLGAVSMHMMFFHYFRGHWPMWEMDVLLGISVFLVYGIDRQIDNFSSAVLDELHAFHLRYRGILRVLFVLMAMVNLVLLFRVELPLIGLGVGLMIALMAYWYCWANRIFDGVWGLKEVFTSLIYSLGILLPTFVSGVFSWIEFETSIVLFLLALMNLWLFTSIEKGVKRSYVFGIILFSIFGLIHLWIGGISLMLLGILSMTWGIHVGIYYFRAQMHMRPWAELAFSSPLIYILCNL